MKNRHIHSIHLVFLLSARFPPKSPSQRQFFLVLISSTFHCASLLPFLGLWRRNEKRGEGWIYSSVLSMDWLSPGSAQLNTYCFSVWGRTTLRVFCSVLPQRSGLHQWPTIPSFLSCMKMPPAACSSLLPVFREDDTSFWVFPCLLPRKPLMGIFSPSWTINYQLHWRLM